ncbi:MAG: hypothetical protein LH628_11875 [Microcoleus sp. CAN_BIN18]|nr:hypothetical protein [Microcoleus sp. CAN_BIN18]
MAARVDDRQIPIEYCDKVTLASGSGDRSRRGIPRSNPDQKRWICEIPSRPARLKARYLEGCRRNYGELRSASPPLPNSHHTNQYPSITKLDRTYHLLRSTDITVSN